jgi:hypothetical protein
MYTDDFTRAVCKVADEMAEDLMMNALYFMRFTDQKWLETRILIQGFSSVCRSG